jgi:DNA-directed RNA polymerase sigma subunit (sigma70/sigma32)
MRFFEGHTLAEIGKKMGISREWVRRLETRALCNLRSWLQMTPELISR